MRLKKELIQKCFTIVILALALVLMLVQSVIIMALRKDVDREQQLRKIVEQTLQTTNEKAYMLQERSSKLEDTVYEYEHKCILQDTEMLEGLRKDLFSRPDLIPNPLKEDGAENPYVFPAEDRKEWFLPLNFDMAYTDKTREYLFYARAMSEKDESIIELLYVLPYDKVDGTPLYDKKGNARFTCVAYNTGQGFILIGEEGTE